MRVTFPHMGITWVGIRHLLAELGFDVVMAPPITRETLELGAKHSPEFICLPFKVLMGNYLQAVDAGADAIFMLGGIGPCRLGYYAEVQREIMRDLALPVRMVVLESDNFVHELGQVVREAGLSVPWVRLLPLARFCLAKVSYLDKLEANLLRERYREKRPGSCSSLFAEAVRSVDETSSWTALRKVQKDVSYKLQHLLLPAPVEAPLRIGLVGEIYMLIEPVVNLHFGERLGELGCSVTRNMYASDWVKEHLLFDWRAKAFARHLARVTRAYLAQRVGGHCFETVGYAITYAQRGYDGLVQILPLTCMPEIIAETILPTVSVDFDIPVLTVTLDEHAGEAGLLTRLEAYTDMLSERRQRRMEVSGYPCV